MTINLRRRCTADHAAEWCGRCKPLVHLDHALSDLVFAVLRLHHDGTSETRSNLQASWDANRPDLSHVGINLNPHRLCIDAAPDIIP